MSHSTEPRGELNTVLVFPWLAGTMTGLGAVGAGWWGGLWIFAIESIIVMPLTNVPSWAELGCRPAAPAGLT